MKNIESQISSIITFQGADLTKLDEFKRNIEARLSQGYEKMKASGLFTAEEIDKLQKYAAELLTARLDDKRQSLIEDARLKYRF